MSLLEDIFLQDEAAEAQELERIIEGDEYDRPARASSPDSDDNSEKEDEAEEDKRRVDPTSAKPKRIVKNPRVILNPARLTGPRGIQVIPEHFKDFKFKGKGHEKEDLDLVLKKLEHWAYRLFPKFEFRDCLKKIETLGNKRPVMTHLTKIRTDQFTSDETIIQRDSSEDEAPPPAPVEDVEDEFDKLLQQQIDLARATPAPVARNVGFSTPVDKSLTMPKATSSPSINEEQRERMLRNRQMAEERRLARLKLISSQANKAPENSTDVTKDLDNDETTKETFVNNTNTTQETPQNDTVQIIDEENVIKAKSRLNVIDSSDEDDALVINESVAVDVHDTHRNDINDDERHSDTDELNKNNLNEEIEAENDVEMNENDRLSNIDVNEETANPTNLDTHSAIHDITEEKSDKMKESSNNILSEVVDIDANKHSEVLSENITENNHNKVEEKQHETNDGVEKTDRKGKSLETELQDAMDVDFSDDF